MGKFEIIGIVVLVMIVALVIWATRGWRKRRREALRRVASMLGLTYEGYSKSFAVPGAERSKLLRRGGIIDELMRGTFHGRTVAVFRYIVVVHYGYGAAASLWKVAAFHVGGSLPAFQMRPQSWLTRIRRHLTRREIIFETHPEVTRRFYITGLDENAIRTLFDGQVLSQLTVVPANKFNVEASGNWLLVYKHPGADLKPENIAGFLEQAHTLARIFLDRQAAAARFSSRASGISLRVR